MMINPILTQQYLNSIFCYFPETGKLTRMNGRKAGTLDNTGYTRLSIHCKRYLSHRLIWMMYYGYWPTTDLDHINRDKSDNRIANLREASRSTNVRNSHDKIGVYLRKDNGKWRSNITVDGERLNLGEFDNQWDAICRRKSVELMYP